jgi:hypothetical protein
VNDFKPPTASSDVLPILSDRTFQSNENWRSVSFGGPLFRSTLKLIWKSKREIPKNFIVEGEFGCDLFWLSTQHKSLNVKARNQSIVEGMEGSMQMRAIDILLIMIAMVLSGCGGGGSDCLLCKGVPSAKPDDNYAPTGEYKGVFVGKVGEDLLGGSFIAHVEKAGGQYFGWSQLSVGDTSAENTQFSVEEVGNAIVFIFGNGNYDLQITVAPTGGDSGEGSPDRREENEEVENEEGNVDPAEEGSEELEDVDPVGEEGEELEYEVTDVDLEIQGESMTPMVDKETTFADCKCYEGTWERSDDDDSEGKWNFLVCGEEVKGVYNGIASGEYNGVVQGTQVALAEGSSPLAQGSLSGPFATGTWSKYGYTGTWDGNQSCD